MTQQLHSYVYTSKNWKQAFKESSHMNVYSSTIHSYSKMEKPKCPSKMHGWIKCDYLHKEISFSHKQEWNTDTCYSKDEPWKCDRSERRQTQNAKYYKILFIWNVHETQIHRDRKQVCGCQGLLIGRGAESDCFIGRGFPFGVIKKQKL